MNRAYFYCGDRTVAYFVKNLLLNQALMVKFFFILLEDNEIVNFHGSTPNLLFCSAWRVVRCHINIVVEISTIDMQDVFIAALSVDDLIDSVLDTVMDQVERHCPGFTTQWLVLQLVQLLESIGNLGDVAALVGLDAKHV